MPDCVRGHLLVRVLLWGFRIPSIALGYRSVSDLFLSAVYGMGACAAWAQARHSLVGSGNHQVKLGRGYLWVLVRE